MMEVNFNEEEAIICFDGIHITIQKDKAMNLAHKILDYFEWYEEDEEEE